MIWMVCRERYEGHRALVKENQLSLRLSVVSGLGMRGALPEQ